MAKYQMIFDTQSGEKSFNVAVDDHEVLAEVAADLLLDLEERGYVLKGGREGAGDVVFKWEGAALDPQAPLPEQGVRPNDIIRIGIHTPPLQLRRDNDVYDVTRREELREGDDIIVGRTYLRFHIRRQQKLLNKNTTFIQRVQQGRSFQQTAYFMSLVGSIAGLCCWFLLQLISLATGQSNPGDWLTYSLLGACIGGMSVGFNDHWLTDRVVPRWILMGILLGAAAGGGAALLVGAILPSDSPVRLESPLLARVLSWMMAGVLIGGAISLRWAATNKNRVLHGLIGGVCGGMLGGAAYWLLLVWRGLPSGAAQALAFMLVGAGIALGISLAPILLRQGVLAFLNSGDPAVAKKYAQSKKQWEIHNGGKYVIGSLSAVQTNTLLGPQVQVYIPDQLVAERHAILTVKDNSYFIEPHPALTGFRPAKDQRQRRA